MGVWGGGWGTRGRGRLRGEGLESMKAATHKTRIHMVYK